MSVRLRIVASLLVSVFFSSLIAAGASAEGVVVSTYQDLFEKINTASDATEIILDADINVSDDESIVIPAEKDITIELNGHTISGKSTIGKSSALIKILAL